MHHARVPASLHWRDGQLVLLDQTRLPAEVIEEPQINLEQLWNSIHQLKVRGAPAIGIAGAYGMVLAMQSCLDMNPRAACAELDRAARYLDSARPTAVNLSWALHRMLRTAHAAATAEPDTQALYHRLLDEAQAIHEEDRVICHSIGKHGVELIQPGMGVLTHCNAGALATSELGTATAPLYLARDKRMRFRVFVDETRPLLQGARLTAWELAYAGIDTTLITDNMAASIMASGDIDLVIVGTDRVAANGDVANKIGTLGVAILARHFGIPFYVACPSSTIDLQTPTGSAIHIEEREGDEVTGFGNQRWAPPGIQTRNPAFDVTPAELVTGLITDRGIIAPPFADVLQQTFGEH